MPKVFFQLLNWIVFIIWLAVGWVLYYLGLPYFLGMFITFVVFIIWFTSWVYVQFGNFAKLEYDDSDKLILSGDERQSLLVTFGMIVFFGSMAGLAKSYITPLSTFIIIAVGIGVIYLFWNKRKK